jgi:dTDP-4-dehydrorhamnose reductase
MKVLLIGATGQLGTDLHRVFLREGWEIVLIAHTNLDVFDSERVEETIRSNSPDLVINTAAFHKVEECEIKPERAFGVNAIGAFNLAKACGRHNATLVHFSTDYVFDGCKQAPYEEGDLPKPLNVYGVSKVAGEELVTCYLDRYYLVRTCGLYGLAGSSGKGGNFVETMLKKAAEGGMIRVVDDQVLTPTATSDLAQTVERLVKTGIYGLYHISCEGACSWHEFARNIIEQAGANVDLVPVRTAAFPSSVKRPSYSVLSKHKLHGIGLSMPPWQESLGRYLESRSERTSVVKTNA